MSSPSLVFCLIVKNESKIIEQCILQNCVRENIKNALIVDTGSTDGTQDIIKRVFKEHLLNGKLIEHSYFNCQCHPESNTKKHNTFDFAENRSYALDQCYRYFKNKASYIFMTDADDKFLREDNKNNERVGLIDIIKEKISTTNILSPFNIFFSKKTCLYYRPLIIPNNNNYRFESPLHEYLTTKNKNTPVTKGIFLDKTYDGVPFEMESGKFGGDRNNDPEKYKKDGIYFEKLILRKDEEMSFEYVKSRIENDSIKTNSSSLPLFLWRWIFYCGQSWRDYNNHPRANLWYDFLIKNKGKMWNEELYCTYKNKVVSAVKDKSLEYYLSSSFFDEGIKVNPNRIEMYYYKGCYEKDPSKKIEIFAEGVRNSLSPLSISKENEFLFYEKNLIQKSIEEIKKLNSTLKNNDDRNCVLFFSSSDSENNFNKDYIQYLKNKSQKEVISVSFNSFTGNIPFRSIINNNQIPKLEITGNERHRLITVDTILKDTDERIDKYFYSSNNILYACNFFVIKYTSNFDLKGFLRKLGYKGIIRFGVENIEDIEDIENIEKDISSSYNYNFFHPRIINSNIIQKGLLIEEKESFNFMNKLELYNNHYLKDIPSLSFDRKLYSLQPENIEFQSDDIIVFFQKAENLFKKMLKETTPSFSLIRSLYKDVCKNFDLIDFNKEDPETIASCRCVKELPISFMISHKEDFEKVYEEEIKEKIKKIKINKSFFTFPQSGKANQSAKRTGKILLSMTSCKRYDLFRQTFISILSKFSLQDLLKIHTFYIVDDGSSDEDCKKMKDEFGDFVTFVFNGSKGHSYSMNCIYNKAMSENFDYVLHLEDDFYFLEERDYITDALKIFETDGENVSQVLFNRSVQEVDLYRKPIRSNYNNKLKVIKRNEKKENEVEKNEKEKNEILSSSPSFIRYFNHKCFVNEKERYHYSYKLPSGVSFFLDGESLKNDTTYWKGFSFMPSIFSVEKIFKKFGCFSTHGFFEGDYAEQIFWENFPKNKIAFLDTFSAYHCSKLAGEKDNNVKNAYELNEKKQYDNNISSPKIVLTTLRLNDSYKKFKEENQNTLYKTYFIDDMRGIFTNGYGQPLRNENIKSIKEYIEDKENMFKDSIKLYDKEELINSSSSFVFSKDIFGFDIGKFDDLNLKELKEKCIELGGNAFNSLGYIKKVDTSSLTFIDMDIIRNFEDGIYFV